ncbi:outer membrane protein [Legionella sp. W05-934-2]|jgi:opacity protein-like surface antigen|uniref:outer membrane protein n=1 Tax=Legionella sp. W05-934-2 TaxID=1198649 RepID=UPI0034623033
MKKIIIIFASFFASTIHAATPIDGWYASAFGGYSYFEGNVSTRVGGLFFNLPKYRDGWNAGGRWGYQSNPMRYELEYTYTQGDTYKFSIGPTPQTGVTGTTSASFGMLNVYYDFPDVVPAIAPFIGAGIGYGYVTAELNSTGPIGVARFKRTDNVFSYQGTVGGTYNFAENYAVNLAYRYVGSDSAGAFGQRYQVQMATIGVIYRFEGNQYK